MPYDPTGVILGVPGLIQLIAHMCRRLHDLQGVVKGAPSLQTSLETLSAVLERVTDEYKKTLNLMNPKSKAIQTLDKLIVNLQQIVNDIDRHLKAVQGARKGLRTIKAWWDDDEFRGLKTQLDSLKTDLNLHVNSIALEYHRKSGLGDSGLAKLPPKEYHKAGMAEYPIPRPVQQPQLPPSESRLGPAVRTVDGRTLVNPFLEETMAATDAFAQFMPNTVSRRSRLD